MDFRDDNPAQGGKAPVNLEAWVEANQPRLHPTRRKVLAAAAAICQNQDWTTSSEVRESTGLSQQLLNRHLHGLEEDGLLELDHPGPGLPLSLRPTPAGLRAVGLRGPHRVPLQTTPPASPAPETAARPTPRPEPGAAAPRRQISLRTHRLVMGLHQALAPYAEIMGQSQFMSLVLPALARRPVAVALHQALAPYLHGMDLEQFSEIVVEVARRAAGAPPPAQTSSPNLPAVQSPSLNPAEEALEKRLTATVHPGYAGLPWWQRTKELMNEWDRARRRHLSAMGTYFTSFAPRWQRPDWLHFNQARREADSYGAEYGPWVEAQFRRPGARRRGEVPPEELYGADAVAAYLEGRPAGAQPADELGPPPYTPQTFSLSEPSHVAYAQRLINETVGLAKRILAHDPHGPARLLAEAVTSGSLPPAALDLAPRWREPVLLTLQAGARAQAAPYNTQGQGGSGFNPNGSTPPAVII